MDRIGFLFKKRKTIYFDGKAFQSLKGTGVYANYYDIESSDEYWISGVKKNMTDRHCVGGGVVMVEKRILPEYLKLIGRSELNLSDYEIVEVQTEIPVQRIYEYENEQVEPSNLVSA